MKIRVWAGKPTLATEQGKEITSPEQLEKWLEAQPAGHIEVWSGRWWTVSHEAAPFTWDGIRCLCAHPKYKSKVGLDPAEYSGFFVHEAYLKAQKVTKFYGGIGDMAASMTDAARGGDDDTE